MSEPLHLEGRDVPIDKLVPLNERNINFKSHRGFKKITATIKAIGLIEPLCVYEEDGMYVILDGFLRYKACQELGVSTVPCIVNRAKEAYTYNRMVNRLSPLQESRMLRQSLGTLDEDTIARVFGIKDIKYRLATSMIKALHKDVVKAVDENRLSRSCATEMTYVNRERQVEILAAMHRHKDYSISFARALIIKTPARQRNRDKKEMRPWTGATEKKTELVSKLEEVQKRYDFYANLYRQYSADLLKLCIYVRTLVTNERIRKYIQDKHPEICERFEHIVFEVGKTSAA